MDGIGALAEEQPKSAVDALKDVYQELVNQELMGAGSEKLSDLMSQIEDITSEQMGNLTALYSRNELAMLIQQFVDENMGGSGKEGNNEREDDDRNGSEGSSQSQSADTEGSQSGSADSQEAETETEE